MSEKSDEEWYLIRGDELRKLYAAKTLAKAKNALDNIYKPLEYIENEQKNNVDSILDTISKRKVVGVKSEFKTAKKDTKNFNKGQPVGNYDAK